MADIFSEDKRSEIMSAIKGRDNKTTEGRFRKLLEQAGLEGWRQNATDVLGKPDFIFDQERVAVFIDGCFWHGCPECRHMPVTNAQFWEAKISKTRNRDERINAGLKEQGWRVIRFWEHELKKKYAGSTLEKLKAVLDQRT